MARGEAVAVSVLRVIYAIWLREMKQFFRERIRIVGLLGQPLLYLFIVGHGISAGLRFAAAPPGVSYIQFMYPGIIGMSVLFTAFFSAMSVIWDREFGFLKEVLVAPVPRWAVALGKIFGGSTVAMVQGSILLLLAPFISVRLDVATVLQLLFVMLVIAFGITSLGLVIAARMESMQSFGVIMNFMVMPLYFLSGAIFPLTSAPAWLMALSRADPLTYGVDALRHILYRGTPVIELTQFSLGLDVAVATGFGLVLMVAGSVLFSRQE